MLVLTGSGFYTDTMLTPTVTEAVTTAAGGGAWAPWLHLWQSGLLAEHHWKRF